MAADQGIVVAGGLTDDTKLYRYLGLSQFLSLIETWTVSLSRIKDWEDTWELPIDRYTPLNDADESKEPIQYLVDNMIGQCWSLAKESDAMWRIYSLNKEGLMIQTTVGKLRSIERIKFGLLAPVIYCRVLQEIPQLKSRGYHLPLGIAFLKRVAFEHEHEVRLITLNDDTHLEYRQDDLPVQLPVNPADLIEDIIIDPRASKRYETIMQDYCERAGITIMPIKSFLYSSKEEEWIEHLPCDLEILRGTRTPESDK